MKEIKWNQLKVGDYMNTHPVTFTIEMPVVEAVERLLSVHQTGGPVIDEYKKVIGFLSEQDCLKQMMASSYYQEQICLVKDIMRTEVLSIKPYTSVFELAQMMLGRKNLSFIPSWMMTATYWAVLIEPRY